MVRDFMEKWGFSFLSEVPTERDIKKSAWDLTHPNQRH
jgi:hypothetical protein